jgi:hypothetical protein
MKKLQYPALVQLLLLSLLLLAPALTACSDKGNNPADAIIPTMKLTVSEIADNTALITSEQTVGATVGAKILRFYPVADLTFDYTIEVKLVKFVEENGEPATLPYAQRVESGLRPGVNYISAIIAYNDRGRAVCSAYQLWTAAGTAGMWSDDNSAGNLDDNPW